MNLRTALLGTLAVALAFGSSFAFATASGQPRLAEAKRAETITVRRDLAVIPSLAPHGAPPRLAQPRRHRHRDRPKRPDTPSAPTPTPTPAPQPPVTPQPRPKPPSPRPHEPDSIPPAQVAPTPVAPPPVEPDPGDQTDEDPNAAAPE